MIPQKLQIKNFLSYGPTLQTIDFTSYSLICLSGKNGHGKSALLDAMTWALWGQARKVSGAAKADQGLLRLGQTKMLVVFDFIFNNKKYRVRREYMETYGKPINSLEFGIIDSQSETFIPLTDKTIKTTQQKIEQTLRLDFESFSNSAFLRQGSSNEFSKKTPKDRKQILATILGLNQYEVIRTLALEKIKDAYTKKTVLITLQEQRTQELTAQETIAIEFAKLTHELSIFEQTEKEWITANTLHTNNRIAYNEKQQLYNNFTFQAQQINEQITLQTKQLKELITEWRIINKKKQDLPNINDLELTKNKIITAITHHQQLFQKNLEQRETLLNLTKQINHIEQHHKNEYLKKNNILHLALERLIAEKNNYQTSLFTHEKHIHQCQVDDSDIAKQIIQHEEELSFIQQKTTTVEQQEAHLEKRKATYQHFVSLGNWINSELNSLSNKKKLVHDDDPSCPLCEQNLSASRRRFLKLNFEKQESFLTHRLRRLKKIIPTLKEILINQHAQITKDKEQLQQALSLTLKIADLNATRTKIAHNSAELITQCAQISNQIILQTNAITIHQQNITYQEAYSNQIEDKEYQAIIQKKHLIEQHLQENIYNEDKYKKDQEKLQLIELQLVDYETVNQDIAQQGQRKNEINKLCALLKNNKLALHTIENNRINLGNLDAQLHTLQNREKELESQHILLKSNKERLTHTQGSIENQQKHMTKINNEFQKEQANITRLNTIIEDYQTIATATGKDGIQALLIEEAIPEIEQEANYLLSRLTNNQAQIFIESLRDLKKGGTKETLDIKISDQAGIRPYELFSGGEAFRIDFALRIAISKLLARRAGTALQTLIIDEGFGSQDEEGLGHIMDALHKIQDDFSKIIIVSHLPNMKDQFPVQFFIEKGVQGSTVSIIEQG